MDSRSPGSEPTPPPPPPPDEQGRPTSALERLRARTAALRPPAPPAPPTPEAAAEPPPAQAPAQPEELERSAGAPTDQQAGEPPLAGLTAAPTAPGSEGAPPAAPRAPAPGPEPVATPVPGERRRLLRNNRLLAGAAVIVAGALVVVLLVGLLPLRRDVSRYDSHRRLVAVVASAARQQTVNYLSYNYKDVKAYTSTLAANTVGTFHTQSLNAAPQVERDAVADHSVSSATVLAVAVVSATPSVASALVIVNNPVTNKSDPGGRVNSYRLQLDLALSGGAWKLSDITTVT